METGHQVTQPVCAARLSLVGRTEAWLSSPHIKCHLIGEVPPTRGGATQLGSWAAGVGLAVRAQVWRSHGGRRPRWTLPQLAALGAAGQPPTRQLSSRLSPAPGNLWAMAGLNVSLSFFFATFALCQVARRASKALLPRGAYAHFAREAAGAAQLGACCLEMRVLVEIGPWAGGFSPDLLLTLLFLLFLGHRATLDGASANPTVSLQEFLLAEASLPSTLLKLAAQALGMQAAGALTRLFWAWELSDMHVLQNLMDLHCSSALRTAVPHGALVEGSGAFFFHLTFLHLRNTLPVYRVPAVALLVTVMACAGETWWPVSGLWVASLHTGTSGRPGVGMLAEGPQRLGAAQALVGW